MGTIRITLCLSFCSRGRIFKWLVMIPFKILFSSSLGKEGDVVPGGRFRRLCFIYNIFKRNRVCLLLEELVIYLI